MKNNKFILSIILIIYQNLYGMNLSEERLKLGVSCVSKMIDFISDKALPELSNKEKAIIHEMFNNEFRDLPSFSQIQGRSSDGIFDLLVDEHNPALPGILRDKIMARCHDLYYRQEIPLNPSFGVIRIFIRSVVSSILAKSPISIGQGVVIGGKCVLTAKHVLVVPEDEYRHCCDLLQMLERNALPSDYVAGAKWEIVRSFSLPNAGDPTKDTTFLIDSYSSIDEHPEIDIACAYSTEVLPCPIVQWTQDLRESPVSVHYLEYDNMYKMYMVNELNMDITSYPSLKARNQCALFPKFMKAGMSGSGVIYDTDGKVCGIFNGIETHKKGDDYISVFRCTLIQKLEKWLNAQIRE